MWSMSSDPTCYVADSSRALGLEADAAASLSRAILALFPLLEAGAAPDQVQGREEMREEAAEKD